MQSYMYKVSENYVELYLRLITLSLLYFLITIQNSYIGHKQGVVKSCALHNRNTSDINNHCGVCKTSELFQLVFYTCM